MITLSLQTSLNSPVKMNQKYSHDYSKANWEGMNHYLLQYDFSPCLSYSCVEVIWNQLLQAINSAVDLFVPKGYLKVKQFPKWFTPALKHELNYIHTFRREFSVWFTQSFKDKLSAAEAHLLESMMEAKFIHI